MKFPFALSALLAATTTAVVRAQEPPVESCSAEKDLVLDGKVIGSFEVTEVNNGMMTVLAKITVNDMGNHSPGLPFPFIDKVIAQVCCEQNDGNDKCSPQMIKEDLNDALDQELTFTIPEPDWCAVGASNDMRFRVFIEDPGGPLAFNQLFPATGMAVTFDVNLDSGNVAGSSYLSAEFTGPDVPEALQGKRWDGYCVDAGNGISTGYNGGNGYTAHAYSFMEIDWANTAKWQRDENGNIVADLRDDNIIGFIDKPWMMPAVAYCVNHYRPGQEYSHDGTTKTLASGTLQKAIWGIIDDKGIHGSCSTCGLQAQDLVWAEYLTADCIKHGLSRNGGEASRDYIPGCNDYIPIIVIPYTPTDVTIQNQFVLTTYADLNIPCAGEELIVDAETNCVTGGSGESGGDPHFKTFGNQWFGMFLLAAAAFLYAMQYFGFAFLFVMDSHTLSFVLVVYRLPWWV